MPQNNSLAKMKPKALLKKHPAFENASTACQAAIRLHLRRAEISDFIKLCAVIGSAHAMGLAIRAVLRQNTTQESSKLCFNL